MKYLKLTFVFVAIFLIGCEKKATPSVKTEAINTIIKEIKKSYAPDKRVALFDAEIIENNNTIVLKGMSTNAKAISDFKEKMATAKIEFIDSLQLLPTADLKDKTGIVINSVANIRTTKGDASELATQALLGTPVKMLLKKGSWYLIQTPDDYIAWVDGGEIVLKKPTEFEKWLQTDKVIFTSSYGKSYTNADANSVMVSDLVAGDILSVLSEKGEFFHVQYPDGRKAYVLKNQAKPYKEWVNSLQITQENLAETSKQLIGLPYLWGGTSPKGVDCSGFTKTVYFLNGVIIPRDASQQVHEGEAIDDKKDYSKLQVGDLLFFGRITPEGKEKVVHVGMWIGNNEFIHSSGRVKINSMDKNAANYDEYNDNRYLRSKRYLNSTSKGIKYLKDKKLYTQTELKG